MSDLPAETIEAHRAFIDRRRTSRSSEPSRASPPHPHEVHPARRSATRVGRHCSWLPTWGVAEFEVAEVREALHLVHELAGEQTPSCCLAVAPPRTDLLPLQLAGPCLAVTRSCSRRSTSARRSARAACDTRSTMQHCPRGTAVPRTVGAAGDPRPISQPTGSLVRPSDRIWSATRAGEPVGEDPGPVGTTSEPDHTGQFAAVDGLHQATGSRTVQPRPDQVDRGQADVTFSPLSPACAGKAPPRRGAPTSQTTVSAEDPHVGYQAGNYLVGV
ncbi:hypothetical protein SUDANB25_00051 [Streptomyces sp. SudanB25_2051]